MPVRPLVNFSVATFPSIPTDAIDEEYKGATESSWAKLENESNNISSALISI